MGTKKKQTKKQPTTKAEPAPQPAPDSRPAPQTVADVNALLELASGTTVTPPWTNRRTLATCPVCNEEHQHVLSYVSRVFKRGTPSAAEVEWLQLHLQAAGIVVATAEPVGA